MGAMTPSDRSAAISPQDPAPDGRICEAGGFLGAHHERNERRTWLVVAVASVMMVAEIIGGSLFGSMALVADGWHMSTHAGALTIAALAYRFARVHASDARFAFGTGKVGELAGFSSAIVLGVVSLLIGWESVTRLLQPRAIHYNDAIVIAVIGLLVNLVSAVLLHQGGQDHGGHAQDRDDDHDHDDHAHDHGHHHDSNLRAAYVHVLADAVTSVMAILGLLAGKFLGWAWMDPVIGVLGALVIAQWSWSLMRVAGGSLLDVSVSPKLAQAIRTRLEAAGAEVSDLHVWRLGPGHQAVVVSVLCGSGGTPDGYKAKLAGLPGLSHVTVEVNPVPKS
ncbi:MAG: CDF family Co(II)/Ni(II) efflux transporter DmeF [Caulobacteraceae bacterium]